MNVAITDGLMLMPPAFAAGLNLWSREDGTPGSASYAGQPNAALVSADQDFAGCLELQKTAALMKLRSFAQTPMRPGVYLRVSARVKAISGNLPTVRIAGWAGNAAGGNVGSVPQVGPEVTLASYGEVVTVSAIIGSGHRQGVDMVWGATPVYGHFGLDLTGPTGGVVRIDDIVVEDVTAVFGRKLMDWVDVRDFGARGDGVADDSAAFAAADAAAAGRDVLVSAGTYRLAGNVTFNAKVRFEGTVVMPADRRLACTRDFNLDTYEAAFGDEEEGFRRAVQALFYFTDHAAFDMGGRRVTLTRPIDVAAVAGQQVFEVRRVIQNGMIEAASGTAWATVTASSVATYAPGTAAMVLSGVVNVANVPVGARVIGTGVGREVYVRSKNVAAGTVELSAPLWGAAGTRTYTFERYQYLLDFSGFDKLSQFELVDLELQCAGHASAIMLARDGMVFRVAGCNIKKALHRCITSTGRGCQDLIVDSCLFVSNEQNLPVQDRVSLVLNVNANDSKIRGNRAARFGGFAFMGGSGHLFIGNHFFGGDDENPGVRRAGLVFTTSNIKSLVVGNYIDNCFIEWTNEHDAAPDYASEYSFGGLTVTGCIFTVRDVGTSFRWVVVTPYGPGHFIDGFTLSDNVFRTVSATVDRVERIDTTHAVMDYSRFRNIAVGANAFNGVTQITQSPVMIEHVQNTAADTWVVNAAAFLPFGGRARNVQSMVTEGPVTTASNAGHWSMPYALVEQGAGAGSVHLRWQTAVKGRAQVTVRVDNPN